MINWNVVEARLKELIEEIGCVDVDSKSKVGLRYGQELAALSLAKKIKNHGAILADEVGLGKTRVALLLMEAVLRAGGTVAAIVPRGLIYQWENEALDFAQSISNAKISMNIRKMTRFEDLFETDISYPISCNKAKCSWPLISQRFGMFSARTKRLSRYDIFGMIGNELRGNVNRNNWNRYIELVKLEDGYGQKEIALKFLKRKGLERYSSLNNINAPVNRNKENRSILQKIVQNEGKEDARKIISDLIGPIDFIVIDEAHKEKGSVTDQKETTNLASLLRDVFPIKKNDMRRLGMTATPVELTVDNWKQLLLRCGVRADDIKDEVLISFETCLKNANKNPDNPVILEQLLESVKPFQDFLGEYVVRRRRCNQDEHRNLLKGIATEGLAHPYRKNNDVNIDTKLLSEAWQKAILCYEGANCAALGTNTDDHSDKFLRRNSSAGLIDIDKDDSLENVSDPKEKRRIFWKNLGNKYARSDDSGMKMHPKVQAAANLIENLLIDEKEKVLVFGTFNVPMRELRDELNWRNYSRRIESGQILKNDITSSEEDLRQIFNVYQRCFPNGKYAMSLSLFKECANNLHSKYEFLQRKLLKISQEKEGELIDVLDRDSKTTQRKLFKKIKANNPDLFDKILECIRVDVLNDFVDRTKNIDESSFENAVKREKILENFYETAQGYLKDVSDANLSADDSQVQEDEESDLIENLKNYLQNDRDSFGASVLCRIMNGDTKWETRRRLQRQFNTEGIAPRVIIAQSMVGREGLNLHKCCRKVVLFHPEWNPGVVEQQIGRVDRIDSLWNKMAESWQMLPESDKMIDKYPYIEVYYIVFKGTYDQHHFEVLKKRSMQMNAQLFGALLDNDALEKVSEEMKGKLAAAAPDFDPCKKR